MDCGIELNCYIELGVINIIKDYIFEKEDKLFFSVYLFVERKNKYQYFKLVYCVYEI